MPPRDKDTPASVSSPPRGDEPSDSSKPTTPDSTRPLHDVTWFVPGKGAVSDADRCAAQSLLQREFGSYLRADSKREEKTDDQPPAQVPFLARDTKKPVDLVRFLDGVLNSLDYTPIGRKAEGEFNEFGFRKNRRSSDVDLCVSFTVRGRPAYYIQMACYFGNRQAEPFARAQMQMVLSVNDGLIFAGSPAWTGILNQRLGSEQGWGEHGLLEPYKFLVGEIADRICATAKGYVEVSFGAIDTLEALYEFALSGREPFPWSDPRLRVKLGDPRRVAMVAYLGRRMGVDSRRLKEALLPHVGVFKSPPYTWSPSSDEYMNLVLANADKAIAQGR